MSHKISIVVPVYNVQDYLRPCLDSILAQTFSDFQVICVEDRSTDGSLGILQEYAVKDARIRIIRHPRNSGLSAARNTGIDEAKGEWVLFVDSDDVISKTLCERTLVAAQEVDADVVFYGHKAFNDGDVPQLEPPIVKPILVDRATLLARKAFAWTKLIRRELLIEKDIRFPVGLCFEDVPVHWRLAIESSKPALLDEAHVGYRQRSGSITYRKDWTRADGFKIYDLVAEQLRKSGSWEEYANNFRVAEMKNFAAIYAYFELMNRDFLPRVITEASRRMTDSHLSLALEKPEIISWQRSIILSVFSRPLRVGIPVWLIHRLRTFFRSIARRGVNSLRRT